MIEPRIFALTPGEPAGIGPDLCLLMARDSQPHPIVAVAARTLLEERARQLGLNIQLISVAPGAWPQQPAQAGSLYVWDTPLATAVTPGQLDKGNAAYVLNTLTRAAQGCIDGDFAGMITAPVHKGVINEAGIAFSGHTEFLAELTHTEQVVMMLATRGLRVALVTTHLPLKDVAAAITGERVKRVARILDHDLRSKFGIARPPLPERGRKPARRRHDVDRPAAGRYPVHPEAPRQLRCGTGDVPRPRLAGTQVQGLRRGGKRHPRPADHSHVGRSRHSPGPGR